MTESPPLTPPTDEEIIHHCSIVMDAISLWKMRRIVAFTELFLQDTIYLLSELEGRGLEHPLQKEAHLITQKEQPTNDIITPTARH